MDKVAEGSWQPQMIDHDGLFSQTFPMQEIILGIDLGTTHSAVGVIDSGFPILLANEEGKRIIPSAVYCAADGTFEVGAKAWRRRMVDPERVALSVKRWIGRRYHELDLETAGSLQQGNDGFPKFHGYSAERLSAEILKELKRIAEWRMETSIKKAIITVPAYFNDGQRAATIRAGELAGLEVVRILPEPTAAALAYGMDRLAEKSRIAVYDLGGGTFDLSILEMHDGVFQVLATNGDTRLGGDDLDALLLDVFLKHVGLDEISNTQRSILLTESQRVKQALSEVNEVVFSAPFIEGLKSSEMRITREMLESLAAPWIARTIRHSRQAMADAGLSVGELNAVVLVGGSTRIPAVRAAVEQCFGRAPDLSQHPDEAIALGACIQAGVLSGSLRQVVLLDVTPLSLGIETLGGLMNVIIARNTTIPCKAGEMFTNAVDGQTSMKLRVLQGEREMARDNWELGEFTIAFSPSPKGQARVGVQFSIDSNGILEVLARDVASGVDTRVTIDRAAVQVDDQAVEAMVSQSVEHAFTDMAERVFTEAKLKAEELLAAIDQIEASGLLLECERAPIADAVIQVRIELASNSANRLKAAVQVLDQATEAMAARLVDQAMEEALQRKDTIHSS